MPKFNLGDKFKKIILMIVRDLFLALFALLVIFAFIEYFKPRIFLNYVNLGVYLAVLLALGVITILFYPKADQNEQKKLTPLDYSTIILLSLVFGVFVVYFLQALGYLSIAIGLCSALVCFFFVLSTIKSE
jgi:O-antigen ligase